MASICSGVDWNFAYMMRTGSPGTAWISSVTATVAIHKVTAAANRRWIKNRSIGAAFAVLAPKAAPQRARRRGASRSGREYQLLHPHVLEHRVQEGTDLETLHLWTDGINPFPSRRVEANMDGILHQVPDDFLHGLQALARLDGRAGLLQHGVELGCLEARVGARRVPQRVENVRIVPPPGHHIEGAGAALRHFVLLLHAGVHGADIHDLDRCLDTDLGKLGLEDLGQLVAVAASPHEHRRFQWLVRPVAQLGEQRPGLFRIVGITMLLAEGLIIAKHAARDRAPFALAQAAVNDVDGHL